MSRLGEMTQKYAVIAYTEILISNFHAGGILPSPCPLLFIFAGAPYEKVNGHDYTLPEFFCHPLVRVASIFDVTPFSISACEGDLLARLLCGRTQL